MPIIGQPEPLTVTFRDSQGQPQTGITHVVCRVEGPGVAQFDGDWTPTGGVGNTIDNVGPSGAYVFRYIVPAQTQSGVWLYRFEAYDISSNLIGAADGSFPFTSSPFVAQGNGQPYPYGRILQTTGDYAAIRDRLGFQASELPDLMIGEADFVPAAEQWVMRRVPDWALILGMPLPSQPTLGSATVAGATLPALTWSVALVARVKGTRSLPGATFTHATVSGDVLTVTAPADPGVEGYDWYAGTGPGLLFKQGEMAPGKVVQMHEWTMHGTPLGQAQSGGEIAALKAATVAVTCSFLCSRFQRAAPRRLKTMNYEEQFEHNWRDEAAAYLVDASRYLGMISTWNLTPALGMVLGHPNPVPTDPNYQTGTDPLAQPNPFGTPIPRN